LLRDNTEQRTPEEGIDTLSRNVGKELLLLVRNDPEERSSHLLRGGSLKLL